MTNVINTLKLVAPEFGTMSDDDIQSWVSLAEPFVSKKVFGKLYTQALAYLTAHMMKMSGNGDTSKGTVGDSMRVASVSEGNTSMSFNTSLYSPGDVDAELNLTVYGIRYRRIRSMCVCSVVNVGVANGRS